MDTGKVKDDVNQYNAIISEIKFLGERKSEIAKRLVDDLEKWGEVDGKGHVVIDADGVKVTHQRRVSQALDMEVAEELLKSKGEDVYDRCTEKVTILVDNEIMKAHWDGILSEAEIDTMFPVKVSFALVVGKAKE